MENKRTLNDIVRNNIIKIIKANDYKCIDIQKKSNFKVGSFYRYLDGGRKISLEVLDEFSKVLNVKSKLLLDENLIVKKIIKVIIKDNN